MDTHQIETVAAEYPVHLRERLGADAPLKLTAVGHLNLLALPKTALFCPARALPQRVPPDWKKPLAAGCLLVISAFAATASRVTADLASRRNEFVAALADEVFIARASVGGHLENLTRRLRAWGIPFSPPQPERASHT